MPPSTLPVALSALSLVLSLCAAAAATAAGSTTPDFTAYRLTPVLPSAVLLSAPEPAQVSATEPRRPSSAAIRLAGMPFSKLIEGAAREASLDPALVHAVIAVESGYNPAARSPKGALGLMQVLPATALRYGIKNAALSPAANLRAGTRYLSELMTLFDQRLELVLAAYNAGEGAVLRYGQRIPPFRETQQYVPAVLARYREWRDPPPIVDAAALPLPSRIRVNYMPGTLLESNLASPATIHH